jgi:alkylated DNA repair dioxygenase AlkB
MRGATQQCWKHQIPKTKKIVEPRINLTFRNIV